MEDEIKRYRMRTNEMLFLSAAEILMTGVTTNEQVIEELTLVPNPRFRFFEYAVIRKEAEEELEKIPAIRREERTFDERPHAVKYVKTNGQENYLFCGISDTKIVPRELIKGVEEQEVGDFTEDLKAYEAEGFMEKLKKE